jgi:hypothetical protein
MGSAATVVNTPLILKNVWEDKITDYFNDDQPFMGLVTHSTDWDGLYKLVTVTTGGMAGRSATFGDAKANKSPVSYLQMQIGVRDNFATWSVDHKLITLSRSDRGALVRALTSQTEAAMDKLKASQNFMNWRDGGGCVGRFSTTSTNTGTLYDLNDIRNFDIGDVIEFAADSGVAAGGVFAAALTITALNEDTGVITFDQNLSVVPGITATPYLFHKGDYNLAFYGVSAYCTTATPGTGIVPASIWGMNRTANPTLLGGSRFTGSNLLLVESIKKALATAYRRRIKTTHLFMPPEVYNDIEMSLQGQRRYVEEKVGGVGYNALVFTTQGGRSVKCYSDADIPKDATATTKYVFGLNLPEFEFTTAGEYPMWLNTPTGGGGEGTKFMVEQNANATEGRLGGYGQLWTASPKQHWNLALT